MQPFHQPRAARLLGVLIRFTAIWNSMGSQNTYGQSLNRVVAKNERILPLVSETIGSLRKRGADAVQLRYTASMSDVTRILSAKSAEAVRAI